MRTQVFISYRRDGGLAAASWLSELLSQDYEVFFDMKSLRNGRFDLAIEKAIEDCTDFLLIMSRNIFSRMEEQGDWISRELRLALQGKKNIIPIFLEGFSFPETEEPVIDHVKNYNGLVFAESGAFRETLRSFLISSPKCVLSVGCDAKGYFLRSEGVEALKALYRERGEQACRDVRVSLALPDAAESALLLLSEESVTPTALAVREQQLLRRRQALLERTERAVEAMLGDACNPNDPHLRGALRTHPLAREGFSDGKGVVHTYEHVAYWLRVISVFLKELSAEESRMGRYGDDPAYGKIYAYFDSRDPYAGIFLKQPTDFGFFSWIPEAECGHLFGDPLPLTSSPSCETLLSQIVPDFYYAVAELFSKSGDEVRKKEFSDPASGISNLCFYRYKRD